MDGVLGAARGHSPHLEPSLGFSAGPRFIDAVFDQGLISEPTFSLLLNPEGKDSRLDLGTPNFFALRSGTDLATITMI